jgi:beta-glucosidase
VVDQPLYRDASQSVAARVDDLVARMSLDEKLAQLGGVWITALVSDHGFDVEAARERLRLGIGQVTRISGSSGLRPGASAALHNEIQQLLVEETRLGIPALVHEESTGGFCARDATVFPQGIGLASTWDPALVEEVADVIRQQMLAVGARHALAPVLDVARDPRWGRVEETYGDDPVLAGAIGTAYVRGLQGDDPRHGVLATGKHFLGYGLPEGGLNHAPVQLGPRELREVFAEPFAAAIRDAGLATVMNSYSSVDGLPCAGSAAILSDLLRGELGFEGLVVADYFSVGLLIHHHRTAADAGLAAEQALSAGLDLELPALDCYGAPLSSRIEAGRVDAALVDRALRRVLEAKFRLGLFEEPFVDAGASAAVFDTREQRRLARRAAASSIVLLSNDGLLPLAPGTRSVAVLGPAANDVRLLQGDYHYPAHTEIVYAREGRVCRDDPEGAARGDLLPESGGAFEAGPHYTPHVTPFEGIRAALPSDAVVRHARGCHVSDPDDADLADAVELARASDVAVVCVGGRSGLLRDCTVGEARDATDLHLTGAQEGLVRAVAATGTPLVVVVMSGRVHALSGVAEAARALLQVWPPGEEGGHALAVVLLGRSGPAGRLPVSLPRAVGQLPLHHDHRAGGGRSAFYGEYSDGATTPLFPFGHGLAYTTFEYGELQSGCGTTADPVRLSIPLTNSGDRLGEEVVQLYVRDEVASVARPDQQLIGFARVAIEPGQTRILHFRVDPSRLAFYDPRMRFVVEPGAFLFTVGASSGDIRAEARVELEGVVLEHRQRDVVATRVRVE